MNREMNKHERAVLRHTAIVLVGLAIWQVPMWFTFWWWDKAPDHWTAIPTVIMALTCGVVGFIGVGIGVIKFIEWEEDEK